MDLSKLSAPLLAHQIEFRIQSINKGGYATLLAYKDARCDMNRLDEVCGHLNWQRSHKDGNKNCIVSIRDPETKEWIAKEDTGTESNTEAEKGLASDSFKRACFNWGIGRELYDYPDIQIKLNDDEWQLVEFKGKQQPRPTWKLKIKEWLWFNQFDDAGNLVYLGVKDTSGKLRYSYDIRKGSEKK